MTIEDISIPELDELPDTEPPRRPWTEREVAILRKYYGRKPTDAIAKVLNRTEKAVKFKARDIGLSPYPEEE